MGGLSGRVALVTGGGGGIGAATSMRLAAEGATVIVSDIGVALDGGGGDQSVGAHIAERIRSAGGVAESDGTDVSDFDAVGRLVEGIVARYGKLDVLVHVAGILRDRMIFNMQPEDWDAVQAVHLKGLFNLTRHASAHWRSDPDPDGERRLITFTSRSGIVGGVGQSNYAAAKLGVVAFTYSCARALARYGVSATCICPTASTRMTATQAAGRREFDDDEGEGSPDNVARVVAYVAGRDSAWLSGQLIGARGYEVSLYSRPTIVEVVRSEQPWLVGALGEAMKECFYPTIAAQS